MFGVFLGQEYNLPNIKNAAILVYEVVRKTPYYNELFSSILNNASETKNQ
jgi:hypothetical protein